MTKKIEAATVPYFSSRLVLSAALLVALATPMRSESQALPVTGGGLISDPSCADWAGMHEESKHKWVGVLLSTMSMGLSRGKKEQKYKMGQDFSQAVASMDAHCAAHPTGQASAGVAAFLNY